MIDLALVAGLGGVGFARLLQASPMGAWRVKPFSCMTCLSGWGAILTAGAVLWGYGPAEWLAASLAGTGAAALMLDALLLARGARDHLTILPSAESDAATLPPVEIADS